MATILIIGAGVMGSALAVPAIDNGHRVKLVGTHLDEAVITALKADRGAHPKLHAPLPAGVEPYAFDELTPRLAEDADLVIVGVSSPGVDWALEQLGRILTGPKPIALVTKGLGRLGDGLQSFVEVIGRGLIAQGLPAMPVIGVGGPCIAKELADRQPSCVVYACDDESAVDRARALMQTSYYRIETSRDVAGVEICAALKNLLTIAVSAMATRYPEPNPQPHKPRAMNPIAAAFNQAVREMAGLTAWLGGEPATAFDLAGLGDLYVTVGGGRNSRLGLLLGQGMSLRDALAGPLCGETVEGVDTGLALAPALETAFRAGTLVPEDYPITRALIAAVRDGAPFDIDFTRLRPAPQTPGGARAAMAQSA
ncbi:MAG: 2-dehydropantoate 2-reductase N-terminal domain-containing protein [Kiloniellales bacterium]